MREKRKTWRDRRCHHGNPPSVRLQLDITPCDNPECFDDALASCGFRRMTKEEKAAYAAAHPKGAHT